MADSNYIASCGVDIDQLFFHGAGDQKLNMYDVAGVDLGSKYLRGHSDIKTGFEVVLEPGASPKDICELLSGDAVKIERTKGTGWYSYVQGQEHFEDAYKAGFELLEMYDVNREEFQICAETDRIGSNIGYKTTVWHAYRVYSALPESTDIEIKFDVIDGGNGAVYSSKIRTINRGHKEFVVAGGGGDKGHRGVSDLSITLRVAGIATITYKATLSIHSD